MTTGRTLKAAGSVLAITAGMGYATQASANEDVLALQADPANAVMPSINYAGWNYSTLDQITLDNVDQLQIAWTWQIGILDSHESPPLVVGDTMYIVSPKPNYVYALDLNADGVIKWEFRPDMNLEEAVRVACCGAQTRGIYYAEGKVFYQTLDGQVFGLDAETGEALWRSVGAEIAVGETLVGNGLVVGNLFITGNAGGEYGVRGKIQAFDIDSGNLQWVMYSMGPDNEVGIGQRFNPFYADDKQGSLSTWYGDSWRRGGGTVWGYFTYDPDINLLYYSTGNCGPWNPDYRREWGVVNLDENGGLVDYRNNWCAGQMARDATTGELIWAYGISPADMWDLDEPLITPLIDLEINGEMRQTAVKASRAGIFYVWDRATGEILNTPWMFEYQDIRPAPYVDLETGRALYDIDKWMFTDVEDRRNYTQADPGRRADGTTTPDYTGTEVAYCPGTSARNWHNDAWSPRTGLLYTVTNTSCSVLRMEAGEYVPGEAYRLRIAAGTNPTPRAGLDGQLVDYNSQLMANDPVGGTTVWAIQSVQGNTVPIVATATDLLFQGGNDTGVMRAYNATNGEVAWEFRTGSRFNSTPITYLGPDGRQYLAVVASSAASNTPVAFDATPDNANRYRRSGSTLYVFALPETVVAN
ncbi:MAG: PQQ-binding-like beta-propeller repeat protein [Bauldia sp.]|nr:PQQ-binding-like beta-propeller repeat protein [Bauldia sp.]